MSFSTERLDRTALNARVFAHPLVVLVLALAALTVAVMLTRTLPLGPMYWDLFIYFDGANRIFDGQIPNVDFFAPVGALGYWLFAFALRLFPDAQPLLLSQWSLFPVTAPLMALVLWDVSRRSQPVALALLLPFLFFAIVPMNVEEFYSYPGFDGFGIYNRQVVHVLYVLTAGLVFMRSQRLLALLVGGSMSALFLLKITGFVCAAPLCLFAFLAGRVALRSAIGALGLFAAVLAGLEIAFGLISGYVGQIGQLVGMNEGELLPRLVQSASIHFATFATGCALALLLLLVDRKALLGAVRALAADRSPARLAQFLDRDAVWLALVLAVGLVFESQNTGGQAFVFIWPVLLRALLSNRRSTAPRTSLVVAVLIAATALPPAVNILHRTARALVGQLNYVDLPNANLKSLGQVSQRTEMMERAGQMLETYARFPETYRFLADHGQLPSFTLYTEPDFQLAWLESIDRGVDAIRAWETSHGTRFDTIMSLNFVNPFPWLMQRHAPLHIAIGADPFRAVPPPDAAVLDAVRAADLVLYPKCPVTTANDALLALYRPALAGRTRVELSPCWDGFLR
ncbi:hypothetical protein NPA31_003730 [Aurantimonas sp. MSK8Z-1]|uniref:hypothetical protein n=1 Tax=Mangrovibrevibacter kandeliae TaxID=2968473 RepID=UPI002119B42F|nr:hypothetical protein [Aurantimonas sp. MSK8Z-1]MCW4114074.1 hypothetical protein [Aurantimonas sp. MSK8Z-1]